jgi:hypothetical protein
MSGAACGRCALLIVASNLFGPAAVAAPLDALLTALPDQAIGSGFVEVATDHMNQSLDIFRVRDSNPLTAGTKAGDYQGLQLGFGLRASDAIWLTGRFWQRGISDSVDSYRYNSWQLAGQYRFNEASGAMPAVALRVTAWGNYAAEVASNTPVTVPGAILNTVKITSPADRQLQADLIGTWKLTPVSEVSLVLSAGSTQLSYGALSGTTQRNGCNYNVSFNGNDIFGTLAQPCNVGGAVIQQFYDSSGSYGVDVAKEIAWQGRFVQAGVNGTWRTGPWKLTGAYLVHAVRRESVDAILAARGNQAFTQNQHITLAADYRFNAHLTAFTRVQLTSNLFFDDVPVTYNSATSARFGSKYSLFTVGMRVEF